ncbi:APC family permease [Phycicoccus endophyticus]|uniref:APC family permease n=1 Tax=Phycicoccus endophyticus TaxID=1690220 RepID=A0A7G9QYU7_9MICO|nr:APC family permease [Phycicoccus endophyticus]NHI20432.1 APC family permease [Phycicoccus endophyticus]QNN48522.1 APC family permease [Phycicoccus endophyticus]GGL30871.1 amino acid permease [Phycicoccus endophyticus]
MAAPATSREAGQDAHELKRHVGSVGLLFASVGSIIGSGWLFGAMNAAQTAGPAAIISWALGGVMILLIGLCYAELGTMFPLSGGVVRFPHIAFGSTASFVTGWITWVACMSVAPIEVEGALQYATKYAPFTEKHTVADGASVHTLTGLGLVVAVVLMAVFVVINYVGVRWFARINTVLVWWKIAIITIVIIAFLLTSFHAGNFTSAGFKPQGWHGVFTAIATSGIVFSYLGFRQGIELAGETDNPRRNVPIAVIGSVVATGVIYVLLQVAFIGAMRPQDFADGWAKVSFTDDFGPLAAIATFLGLTWLAVLLYIDAVVSPADTGLIYITVTARISYAMSRNGNAPQALSRTTNRGVPLVSMLVAFVVGLFLFLPFPSWQQLVGFITSATVLSFGSGPLVLAAMRRQLPDHERPFRVPGGHVIPFLAFWSSNLIVYWTGWATNSKLFVAVLIGVVILGITYVVHQRREEPYDWAWRAGSWYLPWLGGLALISWLGDYDGGVGVLHFDTAIPVTLVFSAAVYWLAEHVRLGTEAVEHNAEQTRAEAEAEDEAVVPG